MNEDRIELALQVITGAALLALFVCLMGCANFSVTQTDESPNERTITTKIQGTTFFSSAQNVTKLKAVQTDKTQSFGTDVIGQQGATNTVEALNAVAKILELLRPTP